MPYTGNTTPNVGSDSTNTLSRDVQLDVLEAYTRKMVVTPLLWTKTIQNGTGGQFIIEGKEDATNADVASYSAGAQVDVTNGTQDEIIINLDRPQYVARRIDKWMEAVANYDTVAMNVRQIGSKLGAFVERKAIAAIEASSLATGLVGNGDGTVVVNTDIAAGGATSTEIGNALADAIYDAVNAIRENDDDSEIFVVMSPTNYSLVARSDRANNADFTNGNGGFDSGVAKEVNGAILLKSNDMPATASLEALAFTYQSAGIVKLWDIQSKITEQPDFLDAKLITAYFSNGMGALRAGSTVSIKSA
jgi:hypothetical protein